MQVFYWRRIIGREITGKGTNTFTTLTSGDAQTSPSSDPILEPGFTHTPVRRVDIAGHLIDLRVAIIDPCARKLVIAGIYDRYTNL